MAAEAAAPTAAALQAAIRATYAAFIAMGFVGASWAARIPQVKEGLHLTPSALGFVLLAMAAGSVATLPLAGPTVARYGSRTVLVAMAILAAVGAATVAIGVRIGVAPVVVGLFAVGVANAGWDVAMNVHGAAVERHLGRSLMPRFHAGFSVGTVAGAGVGAAFVSLGVSVTVHLGIVALATGVVVPWWGARRFIVAGKAPAEAIEEKGRSFAAWREPRTLLIGAFVLAVSLAEGTGNDWISVAMIDDRGAPAAIGTLAYATFLAAMTTGRWFGPRLLDTHGRTLMLRTTVGCAVAGVALFAFAPSIAVALVATVLWGAGASLGFPVGMSAGSDEPAHAAARVGVIASIGYCAFLGGPPLIGFLAARMSVAHALVAVAVVLLVAEGIAGALRPPVADVSAPALSPASSRSPH
jgi:MFS family permease